MSRFKDELKLIPGVAKVIAVLAYAGLFSAMFFLAIENDRTLSALPLVLQLALALLPGIPLSIYVLLVGYINRDSRRRGMRHVLWTLLAIFIPNGIGIILYFILRDPIPVPCPSCATPARKGHAYCASCGAAVRAACPQCRQPLEPGWRNCVRCGAPLAQGSSSPPASEAGA